MNNTQDFAKELRRNSTEAERKLWSSLRARQMEGLKFRRQQPLNNYIVDFICFERKLIIEVDGGQHKINIDQDIKRDNYFKNQGYRVLRFWNNEVLGNIDGVLEVIRGNVSSPSP